MRGGTSLIHGGDCSTLALETISCQRRLDSFALWMKFAALSVRVVSHCMYIIHCAFTCAFIIVFLSAEVGRRTGIMGIWHIQFKQRHCSTPELSELMAQTEDDCIAPYSLQSTALIILVPRTL